MRFFLISDIADFSCIKAHTIRIWERRFNLLKPERNTGNIRRYSLDQVAYLLDVSLLIKAGERISTIANMGREDLETSLSLLRNDDIQQCREINKLIVCMFALDIEGFNSSLDYAIATWEFETAVSQVIMPFLERVDIYSCRNCSAEVDFAVTSIRKKLILAIEHVHVGMIRPKTFLLFLPAAEYFDILLLYFNFLLKKMGFKILYMGTNVSLNKLKTVIALKKPEFLLTYTSSKSKSDLYELSRFLKSNLSQTMLFVSGVDGRMDSIKQEGNLKYIGKEPITLNLF